MFVDLKKKLCDLIEKSQTIFVILGFVKALMIILCSCKKLLLIILLVYMLMILSLLEVILLESSISRSYILHASVHMKDIGALTYTLGIKLTYAYDSLG